MKDWRYVDITDKLTIATSQKDGLMSKEIASYFGEKRSTGAGGSASIVMGDAPQVIFEWMSGSTSPVFNIYKSSPLLFMESTLIIINISGSPITPTFKILGTEAPGKITIGLGGPFYYKVSFLDKTIV